MTARKLTRGVILQTIANPQIPTYISQIRIKFDICMRICMRICNVHCKQMNHAIIISCYLPPAVCNHLIVIVIIRCQFQPGRSCNYLACH